MTPPRLSPRFQPEDRSTASILHEEPWQGRTGLPSPPVLLLALVIAVGLGLLYAASFLLDAEPFPLAAALVAGILLVGAMAVIASLVVGAVEWVALAPPVQHRAAAIVARVRPGRSA